MPVINTYIPETQLYHDLKAMDRDNFSYEGAKALMEYLNEFDENIEYDPIAFCCDFTEYADLDEVNADGFDYESIEEIAENTIVIEFNGGLIVGAH